MGPKWGLNPDRAAAKIHIDMHGADRAHGQQRMYYLMEMSASHADVALGLDVGKNDVASIWTGRRTKGAHG
jgi:hypothetical protein